MGSDRVFRLIVILAAVALGLHAWRFWFVTDDAYISLVYARNLAEHGQLVFNLGERVEGFTNFSWTVLLAGAMKLGFEGDTAALWLGLAFGIGTIAGAMRLLRALLPVDTGHWPAVWSAALGLGLAASASMAAWSAGGLETQMVTCSLIWMFVSYEEVRRHEHARTASVPPYVSLALWAALAATTRPDALLMIGAVALHRMAVWVLARRLPNRHELIAKLLFSAIVGSYFVWRFSYYGYWLPNTYYVKATGAFASPGLAEQVWSNGWYYWQAWAAHLHGGLALWALVAIGGFRLAKRAPYLIIALLLYVPYVASVGGDFMGLFRFVMPVTVIALLAAVMGLEWIIERLWQGGRGARVLAIAALLLGLGGFAYRQSVVATQSLRAGNYKSDRGIDTMRFLIDYTYDRALIGRALAACLLPTDRAIVGGAGAQPYFARMRAIDIFGLVSAEIAHNEPRVSARAGHTKVARNEVLAAYQPTLVFSCYDISRAAPSGDLGCGRYWLQQGFEQITMQVPGLRERGTYYTFFADKARGFTCDGVVGRR